MALVSAPERLVVLAPNWLGDAVMALPVLHDLRRAWPGTTIVVAARKPVAPLFSMVPAVADTIVLDGGGQGSAIAAAPTNARRLAAGSFDAALLLPNSFLSAWLVRRAGIPQRWGIARDVRGLLLTRRVTRPRAYGHQSEYYQRLVTSLGISVTEPFAGLEVAEPMRAAARALLRQHGVADAQRFVVFAPGAAYGRAKQWPPERFADLARRLAAEHITSALVGAQADRRTCAEIAASAPVVNLAGLTDLPTLAGMLVQADHVVSNDSGAMHLAAAVGARVVAIFGPTNDRRTAPLRASANAPPPTVVSTDVWCRPCMLRECPIDHRCMTRISSDRVHAALRRDTQTSDTPSPPIRARHAAVST